MKNDPISTLDPPEQRLFFSIIIPYLNAERTLKACLDSVEAIDDRDFEVILVDDGSQDSSNEIAENYPFRRVVHVFTKGAGAARNSGALLAKGNILLFLDSDIIVRPDIVARARSAFATDRAVAAVVGMYTKGTTEAGFFSVYKNLEHHYEHYSFDKPFMSFVAFAGAVRKHVFEEVNGFNAEFRGATVEDVEFGYRLSQAGYKIVLDKQLMVVHQKKISFTQFIKTELIHRAIPWWVILLQRKELKLNPSIGLNNILSVLIIGLCCALVLIAPFLKPVHEHIAILLTALSVSLFLLNSKFYAFLTQEKSLLFAISGIFTHQLSYLIKFIGMITGTFIYLRKSIAL